MAEEWRKNTGTGDFSSNSTSDREVSITVTNSSRKSTVFSPHELRPPEINTRKPAISSKHAPEQKLTLVALRLAVLEKAASGLGKMAFVWATVVLLGGFVNDLDSFDFWLVAALLLTEGTRVFSRSTELEWQQTNSSWSLLDASSRLLKSTGASALLRFVPSRRRRNSINEPALEENSVHHRLNPKPTKNGKSTKRTWSWGRVHLIPFLKLPAKTVSWMLYILQLASALVSVGFSIARLASGPEPASETASRNTRSALILFYALMLAEASVFLLERAYWEFKLRWQRLLRSVHQQCELDEDDLDSVKMFYYTVYSRCLEKSVFSGLDMDLVGFSLEKVHASTRDEQVSSVKILATLVSEGMNKAEETRRRIGTAPGVTERLLEMVTWRHDTEIRKSVILILSSLVQNTSNCYRICAIAGALEGIASLLLEDEQNDMKLPGLAMLRQLSKDHRNCIRIGNTSGIVAIIVKLIEVKGTGRLEKGSTQWKLCKKSLQVLQTMADTGGESGQSLRKKIALMVYSIKNLKDILQLQHANVNLKVLAANILKSLATDDEIRECIGATGGVIPSLLSLFTRESNKQDTAIGSQVRTPGNHHESTPDSRLQMSFKAGEALNLLVLQNSKNCSRVLNHKYYKQRVGVSKSLKELIAVLVRYSKSRLHAAKILRSLCKCLNKEEVEELTSVIPYSLKMVMEQSIKNAEQEVEAGLAFASAALRLLDEKTFDSLFTGEEHKGDLAARMIELVSMPEPPPRIRRYCVEMVNVLMTKDAFFVQAFKRDGIMEKHLEDMLDTVSDVENFYTFSGTMGLTRHTFSVEELVTSALEKL